MPALRLLQVSQTSRSGAGSVCGALQRGLSTVASCALSFRIVAPGVLEQRWGAGPLGLPVPARRAVPARRGRLHAAEAGAAGTPRAGFCWQRCCRQRDAWCGHGAGCAAPPRVVLPRDDSADGVYAQAGCRAADARARRRCCCPSARCSRTPTPTTRLCRRSPTCARLRLPRGAQSVLRAGCGCVRACGSPRGAQSVLRAGCGCVRACMHRRGSKPCQA